MKKYRIVIKADYDDGDYVERHIDIDQDQIIEYLPFLTRIGEAIGVEHGRWYTGDQAYCQDEPEEMYKGILSEKDIERFGGMVPYAPYGIHSIESIEAIEIGEIFKIY